MTDTTVGDVPVAEVTGPRHPRTSATGRSRIAALDGLRALGLVLIMGFHFGVGWLPGGFVGVDVFYVLSGYLITGLLLGEWARTSGIQLGSFWARRARRLLPALVVVILVVTVVVRFAYPAGLYPDLRMADLSALFYVSNLWQIATSANYFVIAGAVSPLTHTWSLAVEEQFYLVWPLVTVGVLHLCRRTGRGVEALLAIAAAGSVVSALWMDHLATHGASATRLYFGTDTHAQSILVGATLACVLTLVQRRRGTDGMAPTATAGWSRSVLTVVGLAGLAGTIVLSVRMHGTTPFAFEGGFCLAALSAAALIVGAVCVAGGPLARGLALRPFVWVGTVSYGAYLWHFPVWVAASGARTGLSGPGLMALRTALTFAIAAASYYAVERPVMEGTFWRSVRAIGPAVLVVGVTALVAIVATVATPAGAVPDRSRGSVPAQERRVLSAAGAYTTHPVTFLLVGDSTALTLGIGLGYKSVPRYGVEVVDRGVLGCDLDLLANRINGRVEFPTGECQAWRTLFGQLVAGYHPEVVGLLLGRWIVTDHLVHRHPVAPGQPAWDAHLRGELDAAVRLLSSQGAHVMLYTAPYFDPPEEAADGTAFPENDPARVDAWNRVVREVGGAHPGTVTVVDLNALVDPRGRYTSTVGGVQVRWPDGTHFSAQGGEWLQPYLLPAVSRLGLATRMGTERP